MANTTNKREATGVAFLPELLPVLAKFYKNSHENLAVLSLDNIPKEDLDKFTEEVKKQMEATIKTSAQAHELIEYAKMAEEQGIKSHFLKTLEQAATESFSRNSEKEAVLESISELKAPKIERKKEAEITLWKLITRFYSSSPTKPLKEFLLEQPEAKEIIFSLDDLDQTELGLKLKSHGININDVPMAEDFETQAPQETDERQDAIYQEYLKTQAHQKEAVKKESAYNKGLSDMYDQAKAGKSEDGELEPVQEIVEDKPQETVATEPVVAEPVPATATAEPVKIEVPVSIPTKIVEKPNAQLEKIAQPVSPSNNETLKIKDLSQREVGEVQTALREKLKGTNENIDAISEVAAEILTNGLAVNGKKLNGVIKLEEYIHQTKIDKAISGLFKSVKSKNRFTDVLKGKVRVTRMETVKPEAKPIEVTTPTQATAPETESSPALAFDVDTDPVERKKTDDGVELEEAVPAKGNISADVPIASEPVVEPEPVVKQEPAVEPEPDIEPEPTGSPDKPILAIGQERIRSSEKPISIGLDPETNNISVETGIGKFIKNLGDSPEWYNFTQDTNGFKLKYNVTSGTTHELTYKLIEGNSKNAIITITENGKIISKKKMPVYLANKTLGEFVSEEIKRYLEQKNWEYVNETLKKTKNDDEKIDNKGRLGETTTLPGVRIRRKIKPEVIPTIAPDSSPTQTQTTNKPTKEERLNSIRMQVGKNPMYINRKDIGQIARGLQKETAPPEPVEDVTVLERKKTEDPAEPTFEPSPEMEEEFTPELALDQSDDKFNEYFAKEEKQLAQIAEVFKANQVNFSNWLVNESPIKITRNMLNNNPEMKATLLAKLGDEMALANLESYLPDTSEGYSKEGEMWKSAEEAAKESYLDSMPKEEADLIRTERAEQERMAVEDEKLNWLDKAIEIFGAIKNRPEKSIDYLFLRWLKSEPIRLTEDSLLKQPRLMKYLENRSAELGFEPHNLLSILPTTKEIQFSYNLMDNKGLNEIEKEIEGKDDFMIRFKQKTKLGNLFTQEARKFKPGAEVEYTNKDGKTARFIIEGRAPRTDELVLKTKNGKTKFSIKSKDAVNRDILKVI